MRCIKEVLLKEKEIKEARRIIEWVQEHLETVGGDRKQEYIDKLDEVDKLLEKINVR